MKLSSLVFRPLFLGLICALLSHPARGADEAPAALSGPALAAQLSAAQDGVAYVRAHLEIKRGNGDPATVLQLQIKSRRSKASTEVVYQILWPKERKGEGVLLRKTAGHPPVGFVFNPPDKLRTLDAAQFNEPLFGSDLSYADVIENFFAWETQAIVGAEAVEHVNCQILESKPGKGDHSPYASVRTWVDLRRLVPMRVEKYLAPGRLSRRIESTRIVSDEHRYIPANLAIRGPRGDSLTEIDGSRIRHDVKFEDREFTPEGLKEIAGLHTAGQ